MPLVSLDPQDSVPLIDQIVTTIRMQVEERALRAGTRLPMGYLNSRPDRAMDVL